MNAIRNASGDIGFASGRYSARPASLSENEHCFFDLVDLSLGTEFEVMVPVMGGGHALYIAIGHLCIKIDDMRSVIMARNTWFRNAPSSRRVIARGRLTSLSCCLWKNYQTMNSELHVLGTDDFQYGVARVFLLVRLRARLYGHQVSGQDYALVDT